MKASNFEIKDLLADNTNLTFLVGAGCSVDAPSCLPAGRSMIEAIIDHTCAESEHEILKKSQELRFEQLIEIFRDLFDHYLKIIDYYELCKIPNLIHFFLADMIKKGQFVMTTNFDFLIELALLQSGVPKEEIIPVITENDFKRYGNPSKLIKKGKKPIYKIHGSSRNIITGEETRDSLIATIQAFGSNKEGLSVFQIEPFKAPLFKNISSDRSLVVMGYSGSDDFDIVPTLKNLKDLTNIFWFNHKNDDDGREKIFKYNINSIQPSSSLEKTDQILIDIFQMNHVKSIFRIDANTQRFIKIVLGFELNTTSDKFKIDISNWLTKNIKMPDDNYSKFLIPSTIYHDLYKYDHALRCNKLIYDNVKKSGDLYPQIISMVNMGGLFGKQENFPEALKWYEEALQIVEKQYDFGLQAKILNNMGVIYHRQAKVQKSLDLYQRAYQIFIKLNDWKEQARSLLLIGGIEMEMEQYQNAFNTFRYALHLIEKSGDLETKADILFKIGYIYEIIGNYGEARKEFREALNIYENLHKHLKKGQVLAHIGGIYHDQKNYKKALEFYGEAFQIYEDLGLGDSEEVKHIRTNELLARSHSDRHLI
ncbi:MAG: tetratricopeptide repeat protein [Candidatus Hodarchaeota archaeon]